MRLRLTDVVNALVLGLVCCLTIFLAITTGASIPVDGLLRYSWDSLVNLLVGALVAAWLFVGGMQFGCVVWILILSAIDSWENRIEDRRLQIEYQATGKWPQRRPKRALLQPMDVAGVTLAGMLGLTILAAWNDFWGPVWHEHIGQPFATLIFRAELAGLWTVSGVVLGTVVGWIFVVYVGGKYYRAWSDNLDLPVWFLGLSACGCLWIGALVFGFVAP